MREIDFDTKSFPTKHPSGQFGLDHPREEKITKQVYFRTRLFHYTGIFAHDHDYILMAQSYVERAAIEGQINISAQRGVMKTLPDGTKEMKLSDDFNIFKTVPGTPRYWQGKRNNLLAVMNSLGPFHLFFTFSCAEKRWPEVISYILRNQGHNVEFYKEYVDDTLLVNGLPLSDFLKKSGQTVHELIQKNTFDVVRMFDNRIKSFIKNILLDKSEDGLQIKHYSYRVEFQARGMPHIHGVAWLDEDVVKDYRLKDSSEFDLERLPTLIDSLITCQLPEDVEQRKVVQTLQTHTDSKTCFKNGPKCRFGFKKLPSDYTLISTSYKKLPLSEDEQKDVLKKALHVKEKMKNFLESENFDSEQSLAQILESLQIQSEDYHDALKISDRGTEFVLKRTPAEASINGYNWHLLESIQSNMDLQFCIDSYAVVTYITDYLSKDETQMTSFLSKALKEAKSLPHRERMNHLKKTYIGKREIGLPEAIYRAIPSLHLQDSNIGTVFIQSGFPSNNSKFLRRVYPKNDKDESRFDDCIPEEDSDQNDEEDSDDDSNNYVKIAGREGFYQENQSLNDIYPLRPHAVESLTLSQFGISYVRSSSKPKKVIWQDCASMELGFLRDFSTDELLPKYLLFHLNRPSVYRLRTYSIALKIHVSSKKQGHEEIFAEMQLFTPWRNLEQDLGMSDPEKCKNLFNAKRSSLLFLKKKVYPFSINELIEEVKNNELLNQFPDQLTYEFDPEGAQENLEVEDLNDEHVERPAIDFEELNEDNPNTADNKCREERFQCLELWNEDYLLRETRFLAEEQRAVLQKVLHFVKGKIRCQKNKLPRDSPEQLLLIVHGGGGKF